MRPTVLPIPPGGARIARIAKDMGYRATFSSRIGRRGDGTEYQYALVYAPSHARKTTRHLGNIEKLARLSNEEVRARIAAKFALRCKEEDAS